MKTRNFFIFIFVAALTLLTIAACNSTDPEPTNINLSLKSEQLVEADNAFGLDIFARLHQSEEGNFNISPLSIAQALAMTYNGARGETKAAMEEALKKAGFTTDEINRSYQSLVNALLAADKKVMLEIAQSIWYRQNFEVIPDFIAVNQEYYNAEVSELDFGSPNALKTINGWIEDKTHGRIKDMIKEITPTNVMFLVNAVYFYGEWQRKFEKKETYKGNFTKADGKTVEVDMMGKTDSAMFFSNDLFSAIQLPYGHGNFNMTVMVPNAKNTCEQIVNELNAENWAKWTAQFSMMYDLNIALPKFKSEYEVKLNDVLAAMGMGVAFSISADFSGITPGGGIYIDYVQHNTFIEVDENGTEAAAATVVAMDKNSASPFFFRADKPFIYAITEKETGAILFIGKMANPAAE
ncbi:MAG TPA: serpin family protein [Prolixibacteraceae bacterium]|nr:serpin family protein [Prolixibacteraceae bacterium]